MEKINAFKGKYWGVFYHFLSPRQEERAGAWSERVAKVDVDLWADQLKELGADFMGVPIMQCSKHMLAPNSAYDAITGYKPGEACAERDFIMDLSDALRKRGIDLMLYYTCDGPLLDAQAARTMKCPPLARMDSEGRYNDVQVSDEFVDNWTSVLKEYVLRYGKRPFAWWFDGAYDGGKSCYFSDTTSPYYIHDRDRLLKKYKDTVKLGNPDAAVCFNGGIKRPIARHTPLDDFTAGEDWIAYQLPEAPLTDGAQWFQFLCGWFWYKEESFDPENMKNYRITPEFMLDYTQKTVDKGGVVMYDVRFNDDALIEPKQFEILSALKGLNKHE